MSKEKFIKIKLIQTEWKNFLGKVQLIMNPQEVEPKNQYFPLTPIQNADEDQAYTEMLTNALQQKDVKNIALTGPYGSGKSSVLLTFQKTNPNWNYLNISLATFKDNLEKDINDTNNKEVEIEAIEKSILQQLFYSVDQKKLPKSRLKRIVSIKTRELIGNTFFIIIWIFLALLTFSPENIILKNFSSVKDLPLVSEIIIKILFVSYCIVGLFVFLKYIEKIKELKLKFQDTEITLNNNEQESILNKHLDEILYFFEETNFDIIIIEDLDRFNNTEIFIRLRELNTLINAAKQVNRRVIFLYAIKDDMFKNKDRAKFFDFIIPIIPVINPTNAYDLIKKNYINDKTNKDLNEQIDEVFLHQISLYFDDLRLVINIFNEFELYVKKLNNNNLNKNKLLAIIIYKNYYPSDFAELHKNRGEIYNIFNEEKFNLINKLKKSLELEVNSLEKNIDLSNNEELNSIKDLRKIYLYEIQKKIPLIENTQCNYYSGSANYSLIFLTDDKKFNYDEILNNILLEDENFEKLQNSEILQWKIEVQENNTTTNIKENEAPFTFSTIEILIDNKNSYEARQESIKNKNLSTRNEIINKRKVLIDKINTLRQSMLKELISLSNYNFFNDEKHPKLLQFLIREGYIDENYADYISFFFNSVITIEERDYAQRVLNQINSDYKQPLINIKRVFDRYLTARQFSHSSILNFNIVDYVIQNKFSLPDHYNNLFILLSNGEDRSKEFISAYIDRGTNSSEFSNAIISYWENFFEYLLVSMTKDQLEKYLYSTLASITNENIKNLNKDYHLSDYISSKEDFIIFINKIYKNNQKHILNFLSILSPVFNFLECNHEDLVLFNEICKKEYFSFNKVMILQIILLNNEPKDHSEIQVNFDSIPYGIVQKFSPEYLKIQVDKSLNRYFEEVVIPSSQDLAENSDNFIELLNTNNLSKAHKEWLIKNNKVKSNLITDIHIDELWELLLINNRVKPSWDSLIEYYKNNEQALDSTIIDYINLEENYKLLESQEISESSSKKNIPDIADKFEIELIESDLLNDSAYEVILSMRASDYNSLDLSHLSKSRISRLIDEGVLQLTIENITNLRIVSIDFVRDLLIKNLSEDCIEIDEDLGLTIDEFEAILLSKKLENSKKIIIVQKLGINFYNKAMIKLAINDIFNNAQSPLPVEYIYSFFEGSYPTNKKIEILISQISNFDHPDITNLLNLLDEPYNKIPKIGSHTIKYSEFNENLINTLKRVNYINGVRVNYSKSFLGSKSKSSITFITK